MPRPASPGLSGPLPRRVRLKRALPALATVLLTSCLQALGTLPALAASQRVGVWLTNSPSPLYYDANLIEKAVAELDAAGFNTLYPNVWSRGYTFHRSRYAPIEPKLKQVNASLDPICRITKAGQKRGMKVIPWFEYGLMEPADAEVVRRHPEWVLQRSDGSTLYAMHGADLKTSPLKDLRVWLNPSHPGVRERVIGLIGEIVQRCGVDGIQLDDHFAWPVELGYDAYTRALFRAEKGREPPRDYNNREWMTWRRQKLTGLLRDLRATMQKERSGAVISHSPGPFRFAYNHWLQDWEIWALGQLVDELVVQNYAYSVAGFTKDLDQAALVKARRWGMPVQIGVLAGFGGRSTSSEVLGKKVEQVARRGLGVIYFYWEGLWGAYGGPEGASARRSSFQRLHGALYPDPYPRSSRPRL
ncbi:family 10 glycosylhydrolase [Synechococcus sp. CBW1107]|nr:family 10 glycosylhydrolase [Synechococcus sp. CBW1107]